MLSIFAKYVKIKHMIVAVHDVRAKGGEDA
jgi:hypothetical protein